MKCVEKYCDICGAKEKEYAYEIKNRIKHFSVRTKGIKWEKVDVCSHCYEEMCNLVKKKKQALKQTGE